MINYIEKRRKTLSLLFALFMVVLVLFITMFSHELDKIDQQLTKSQDHRNIQIEKYKELHRNYNEKFLSVIEKDWDYFTNEIKLEEGYTVLVQNFVDSYVRSLRNTSDLIVIAVSRRGEIIYEEYADPRYKDLDLSEIKSLENEGSTKVMIDGKEDIFCYKSRELHYKDLTIKIYIGFLENLILEDFIDTADIQILKSAKQNLHMIITLLTILMITLGALGLIILYQIIQLGRNFKPDEVTKYGSMMLMDDYIDCDECDREEIEEMLASKIKSDNRVSVMKLLKKLRHLFFAP